MPRHQAGLHHRRVLSNALGTQSAGLSTCSSSCRDHDHSGQQDHQHNHESNGRPRSSTTAHAAAGSTTWDFQQDSGDGSSTPGQQQQCCGGGHSHGHHHHHHGHGHGHHHHFHTDAASHSSNPVLSVLSKTGFFSIAERLEHNVAFTVTSIGCYIAALLLPYAAAQSILPAATAALLAKVALSVTYVLSGLPQLAETVYAAVAGKIDTHVLMSLSVVGTLYMGLAQEGALLLLLFRASHQLEDRLTEKAAGGLQRLFDSVPDRAVVVELEPGSNSPKVSTSQEVPASAVAIGQHVLVRPGEQVPLDGIIAWGTANLSLQHISGEAQPVKLGPGQEVPAGSLSTDGLLVVRVIAAAENSTPARIAQLAAEAQATRPQLTRWLDSVGSVWSKAVIGATLATAAVLPLLGVPFWGDRGALYRAMGVLTAGSPCALALVPLAYACAIAAITARGILVKSGSAIDALAACKTIALDKTGTITTGSLNLAEGFVITAAPASSSSSGSGEAGPWPSAAAAGGVGGGVAEATVRAMQGLAELCKRVAGGAGGSGGASIGTTTSFGSAFDSDDYGFTDSVPWGAAAASGASTGSSSSSNGPVQGSFDLSALKCAVALSRLSNHPVSRAMVDSAPHVDGDVTVLSFEQVPGAGVQGVCRIGDSPPVHVMFGGADWINSHLSDASLTSSLNNLLQQHHDRPSRATAVLSMAQLLPITHHQQAVQQEEGFPAADPNSPAATSTATATAAAPGPQQQQLGAAEDAAMLIDAAAAPRRSSKGSSSSRPSTPVQPGSRPSSPMRLKASHGNRDGSITFSFEEESAEGDPELAAAAAAVDAITASGAPWDDAASSSGSSAAAGAAGSGNGTPSSSDSGSSSSSSTRASSSGSSVYSVSTEPGQQGLGSGEQRPAQQLGSPGQPSQLVLLCFEDVIQAGVPAAVKQLQSGSWSKAQSSGWWGRRGADATKEVVMLTGDNQGVAQAVAHAVGIQTFKAGLKPEDKLSYVRAAAAEAAAAAAAASSRNSSSGAPDQVSVRQAVAATGGAPPQGLLMAGDGINDAPALAAAQVGVAIASTPKDMVAAAADIIVLNGQGITNLPWLFQVADRTHAVLKQNLALALLSVVMATVPTVAGIFPLWLAVTLHEGSTLLVALNSLRLLLDTGRQPGPAPAHSSSSSSGSDARSGFDPQPAAAPLRG